ncbi:MAG: HlyD family secretion protein, partial [Chloroflexi bacterium]|nr:HlyD family secretion protein [Chloroflexota bacterium]
SRIALVKVGQPVRVRIRALKMSFPGRVEQISQATTVALGATGLGAATSNPVEVPVRISVDTRGYRLYPGMSAEIHVQVEPRLW